MLAVSVLGPIELRRDGHRIPVRPGKTTEVLIRLALDAGVMVRSERLIEDLWGEDAVATRRNTLQTKISRLRRSLGDAATVTSGRGGYTLGIDPSAVDALEVLQLAETTSRLIDEDDPWAALETCNSALALFRGEVLCDAGDGDWLVPHRVRLEHVRLRLIEDQLVARLQLGAAGDTIAEIEALVVLHPLRERLWVLLITALYRDGRQADALAAYQRVRTQLVDALGLDPGPELQALEQQVLEQDVALDSPRRESFVSIAIATEGNLPALASPLVGREVDLRPPRRIGNPGSRRPSQPLSGDVHLTGKTRVAIEVGRAGSFAGGRWLVRLEGATSAASVVQTVGEALNLNGATEATLLERLRAGEILLVLDNCEHVLDAVASLTNRMLDGAPHLRVLATSQVPLGLDGEAVYFLDPLSLADSISLFAQRAVERRRSFVLDQSTTSTLEDICRSLDGLPLAIELAAARTKVLSVQEIARRLDDRFALLHDPSSRQPERRRALSAAIGWSYDLLFPDEKRGLWAMACFTDGAPIAAVESVLEALGVPKESAVDVIGRLADRSLVNVEVADENAVRYRLLDSVRAFAVQQMAEAGVAAVASGAHAAWLCAAADQAATELRGPEQGRHLDIARAERANIDAALAWAGTHRARLALRIANGFGWAWVLLGERTVGAERLRAALQAADDVATPAERVTALSLMGWLEAAENVARAHAEADLAMSIADATGDAGLVATSRMSAAFVLLEMGRARAALELLDGWRARRTPTHGLWEEAASWVLSVMAATGLGETTVAKAAAVEATALVARLGDDWALDHLESVLGHLAQAELRFPDAIGHLTRAADAAQRLGFSGSEGFHLANLGRVQQLAGDDETAFATLTRAVEIGQATAELRLVALACASRGYCADAATKRAPAPRCRPPMIGIATLEVATEPRLRNVSWRRSRPRSVPAMLPNN